MTREEMIIEFYENGEIPLIIKFLERLKNEFRNNNKMDRNANNTIYNDSNSNARIN